MPSTIPKPPPELSTRSKSLWRAVLAAFALEPADTELLRNGLIALDRADAAAAEVVKYGVTVLDRYGTPKTNPAVDVELRYRAQFARVLAQLGVKSPPDEAWNPTRAKAQRAAQARWGNK